jgi:single-strand DNA-binding protein
MLNRVILVGRLATDPELKITPSSVPVCTFRLAVNRPYANAQGEREADFIDIVTWRQTAEFSANYLSRGTLIAAEGRLQIRSYEGQDGVRRRVAEVVCDNVRLISRPREQGQEGSSHAPGDPPPAGRYGGSSGSSARSGGAAAAEAPDDISSYDDPFADE